MTISISKNSKIILCALIPLLILSACGTAKHDTSQSTSLVLPPVIPYSREFQNALADEAEGGHCINHIEFGKDYLLTRDRITVAQKLLSRR